MEDNVKFLEDGTTTIEFSKGVVFTIKQISAIALYAIQSSKVDKPTAPFVKIKRKGRKDRKERNPDDPDFKALLATWQQERQAKLMQYSIAHGVVDEPPSDYYESAEGFIDSNNDAELKFFWVAEQLSTEEIEELFNALIELAQPTEDGISDAEETFLSNGQPEGRETL